MSLLSEVQYIPTLWKDVILDFIRKNPEIWESLEEKYTEDLNQKEFYNVFPEKENIFRCFHYFDPKETKVVLMGQDPYHGPNQATGLCFGVNNEIPIPPSLRNIKKELFNDLNQEMENSSLEHWAKQGILMLNASLSVRQGCAASHMKFWLPLTKFIMQFLNENHKEIVYLIWGAFAHKQVEEVINWEQNHLVISSHPSPLSATKAYRNFPPFIGSKPFSKVNAFLKAPIEW